MEFQKTTGCSTVWVLDAQKSADEKSTSTSYLRSTQQQIKIE